MKVRGQKPTPEEMWRFYLTEGYEGQERRKHFFRLLPSNPRCKVCYAPFKGIGGTAVRMFFNIGPSALNPSLCNACERVAKEFPGGTETDLVMVFADIRGSTTIAEKMSSTEFRQLINRFYSVTSDILIRNNALIDRLVGDEVIGYFFPGPAGLSYPEVAVKASIELLQATGNTKGSDPWVPIGIGIHKGRAFYGVVGNKDGITDITALGDAVNTAARLASQAGQGEILISEEAYKASGLTYPGLGERTLALKGRSEPVMVKSLYV